MLRAAKQSNPKARWWIKADANDLKMGIRTSMTNQWSGDVDMGNGDLQKNHAAYEETLKRIDSMKTEDLLKEVQTLKDDIPKLKEGRYMKQDT